MIRLSESQILDVLPHQISDSIEVKALSYAIHTVFKRWCETIEKSMVVTGAGRLPEDVLDASAAELNVPYYDSDLPLSVKRSLVESAMVLYRHMGTRQAVEDMIGYVFGSGEVIEWDEMGTEAGTFQISTTTNLDPEKVQLFHKVLRRVKSAGAKLLSISRGQRLDTGFNMDIGAVMAKIITIK